MRWRLYKWIEINILLFTFWYESVLRRVEVVAHVHISSDSFICREKVYFNGRRENEVSLLLLHLIFMHIFLFYIFRKWHDGWRKNNVWKRLVSDYQWWKFRESFELFIRDNLPFSPISSLYSMADLFIFLLLYFGSMNFCLRNYDAAIDGAPYLKVPV